MTEEKAEYGVIIPPNELSSERDMRWWKKRDYRTVDCGIVHWGQPHPTLGVEREALPFVPPGRHLCVDLDGTLAHFDHWRGPGHIGDPVPAMLARVKAWRAAGLEVRIFTSRVSYGDRETRERDHEVEASYAAIDQWSLKHLGEALPITCEKSFECVAIYDDRAFRVEENTGRVLSTSS